MKMIKLTLHFALSITFLASFAQVNNQFGELDASRTIRIQIINEEQAINHCFKAQNQFDKENYDVAIKQCDKALVINPSCAAAYRLRGYAKIMIDSINSGCADLEKASKLGESSIWGKISNKHYERYCNN